MARTKAGNEGMSAEERLLRDLGVPMREHIACEVIIAGPRMRRLFSTDDPQVIRDIVDHVVPLVEGGIRKLLASSCPVRDMEPPKVDGPLYLRVGRYGR